MPRKIPLVLNPLVLKPLVLATLFVLPGLTAPVQAQSGVTAYEGARLILGDGGVVDSGTLVVDGARIVQVGPTSEVRAPS
jgi:hypothetical protein